MTSLVNTVVRRVLRQSAPAIAAVVVSTQVMAADQAAAPVSSANDLGEIIVTAQFRQQKLQDTPIAITAVNAAMMEARGQSSLHDLSAQAPGVQLVELGGAWGPSMSANIRGIGQADFDPALSPGVGMYIDDVYYTSLMGSNFALLDLERVEIQRGPQGTLAGANSEGGAVKLYSVKPQGNDSGSVKVSYGERNLIDVQAMADTALIKDTLFARVSGVSRHQDGYVTRIDFGCANPALGIPANGAPGQGCISGHEGGKNYIAGRAAFRWLASDSLEANLAVDVTKDTSEVAAVTPLQYSPPGGPSGTGAALSNSGLLADFAHHNYWNGGNVGVFIPSNPYQSYADFCAKGIAGNKYCWAPYTDTKAWGTNLTLEWKLAADLSLKSITAYRAFDTQYVNDDDASPIGYSIGYSELINHTLTEELRLSGKSGDAIDYTVGGFFLNQTTTYPTHQVLDYIFPGSFEFLGNDPVTEKNYAGFADGTWHISSALNLNVGLRYTHQEKTYTYNRTNPSTIGGGGSVFFPPGFSGTPGSYSGSKLDYRADLDYRWNDAVMTYASISTGFKGGGTNPRPFLATQIVPFKEEKLTAYEVGAKTDFLDKALRVNVSLFYNKFTDIQMSLLSCPQFSGGSATEPCAAPVNGGDADIYGAELEVSYHLGGLSLDGSYSRQHFEYKTLDTQYITGITKSDVAPGFQDSKYSVGAQYDIPVGDGQISPRIDYVFNAGYYTNAINADSNFLPGYHSVNGRITYQPADKKWEVALAGSNIGNKLYYTSVFDLTGFGGFKYGQPAAPRTIWAEVKKKF